MGKVEKDDVTILATIEHLREVLPHSSLQFDGPEVWQRRVHGRKSCLCCLTWPLIQQGGCSGRWQKGREGRMQLCEGGRMGQVQWCRVRHKGCLCHLT